MELGEKMKKARLEAGLSQRQLCGEEITRNMLSQIENGAARPSMATLSYLAERLHKPVSWFVDADAEENGALVEAVTLLRRAGEALEQGRDRYARELLQRVVSGEPEILRQKLLLLSRLPGADPVQICAALPSLDEELLLRADASLLQGNQRQCGQYLDTVQNKSHPKWLLLRGNLYLAREEYEAAAACLGAVETVYPEEIIPKLEQCCRELGDYKRAYEYACKQKK